MLQNIESATLDASSKESLSQLSIYCFYGLNNQPKMLQRNASIRIDILVE